VYFTMLSMAQGFVFFLGGFLLADRYLGTLDTRLLVVKGRHRLRWPFIVENFAGAHDNIKITLIHSKTLIPFKNLI
jgi:hypothetical protein